MRLATRSPRPTPTAPTGAQETEYVVDNTAPSPVDPIAARVGGTSLVVTFDEALDAASSAGEHALYGDEQRRSLHRAAPKQRASQD